jgi:hypothetical protein
MMKCCNIVFINLVLMVFVLGCQESVGNSATKQNDAQDNADTLAIDMEKDTIAVETVKEDAEIADTAVVQDSLDSSQSSSVVFDKEKTPLCSPPKLKYLNSNFWGYEIFDLNDSILILNLPQDANEFVFRPIFYDDAVDFSLVMGDTNMQLTQDTTIIKFTVYESKNVTTNAIGEMAAECLEKQYELRVIKNLKLVGEFNKMEPTLQAYLAKLGEEDSLTVGITLKRLPEEIALTNENNSLTGITRPYTNEDIDQFMAEQKIISEQLQLIYEKRWEEVFEKVGIPTSQLPYIPRAINFTGKLPIALIRKFAELTEDISSMNIELMRGYDAQSEHIYPVY